MYKIFCDKCKKEFDAWHQECRYEFRQLENGALPRRIDLCDNCRRTFENWMNEFLENEEVGKI